jgi:hypothetical protein
MERRVLLSTMRLLRMAEDYQRLYATLAEMRTSRDAEALVVLGPDMVFTVNAPAPARLMDRIVREAIDEADFS